MPDADELDDPNYEPIAFVLSMVGHKTKIIREFYVDNHSANGALRDVLAADIEGIQRAWSELDTVYSQSSIARARVTFGHDSMNLQDMLFILQSARDLPLGRYFPKKLVEENLAAALALVDVYRGAATFLGVPHATGSPDSA